MTQDLLWQRKMSCFLYLSASIPVLPTFRVTNVFDIAQTSGPPLPTLVDELEGNVERYQDFVQAIRTISSVPVNFEDMEGQDGYYHQIEKRIAMNNAISERQTMDAMIHELAHAKLHALDPEHLKESAKARGKDQRTMEVELVRKWKRCWNNSNTGRWQR